MSKKVDILFDMDDVLALLTKNVVTNFWNEDYPDSAVDWKIVKEPWWTDCGKDLFDFDAEDYFKNLISKREGVFINSEPDTEYLEVFKGLVGGNALFDSDNSPIGSVGIVTRPVWKSPYCMNEKVEWIEKHIPNFDIEYGLHMTASKSRLATPHTILIDDNIKNIKKWTEKGGVGILVARKSNESASVADYHTKVSNGKELVDAIWNAINEINKPQLIYRTTPHFGQNDDYKTIVTCDSTRGKGTLETNF